MTLFEPPAGLTLVKHFSVPETRTWGDTRRGNAFKACLREAAALTPEAGRAYQWFVFSIHIYVDRTLTLTYGNKPDIENFPKLIVDAFTGVLYPDDHLDYVRGVQVEGTWVPRSQHRTEVRIWGKPLEGVKG